MSQLIIADLNFLNSEFPCKSEVMGGDKKAPSVSTAYSVDSGTAYKVGYNTKGEVTAKAAAAAGGAAAGAVSLDGKAKASAKVDVKVN